MNSIPGLCKRYERTVCDCKDCNPTVPFTAVGNKTTLPSFVSIASEAHTHALSGLVAASNSTTLAYSGGDSLAVTSEAVAPDAQFHVTSAGDVLASYSEASKDGFEFSTILNGMIGPIPVQIALRGTIDLPSRRITICLQVLKPIETDEYCWTFEFGGFKDLGNDRYFATDVSIVDTPGTAALKIAGLDWWCVLRCGGISIIEILASCLPSLAGGIPAYVACATSNAGSGAAKIALCIATKCV